MTPVPELGVRIVTASVDTDEITGYTDLAIGMCRSIRSPEWGRGPGLCIREALECARALGSTFHANACAVLDAFAGLPLLNRRHCWDTLAVVSRYRQTGRLVYFRRSDRR